MNNREALVERIRAALTKTSHDNINTGADVWERMARAALAVVEAEQPKTHAFWDGTKFTAVYEGESPHGRWMPYAG